MTRLLVHVEGQTEETFVNEAVAPYLYEHGLTRVSARLIGNARQRSRRGGIKPWPAARRDIVAHLRQDQQCVATLMVDYYGMPQAGSGGWPGRSQAADVPFPEKAQTIQDQLQEAIREEMGSGFDDRRFIPYVMMHEFEAMLFSDCERFGEAIGQPELTARFQEIRDQFSTPEEIDDSPDTAPSRRIVRLIPGYQKPLMGNLAALAIGLDAIRSECPNFRCWLERLERVQD